MLPVVVLAGGLGTRIASLTGPDTPKAMLPVAGRPFIDWKLASLSALGTSDIVMLLGHGADQIREHLAKSAVGPRVVCIEEGARLLGTGGSVANALRVLPARFWLTYGDTLVEVPVADMERRFETSGLLALMSVCENRDGGEPNNVSLSGNLVAVYDKSGRSGTHHYIDYGMLLFAREAFREYPPDRAFDLGDILQSLAARRKLGAYVVSSAWYDIGTPARVGQVEEYLKGARGRRLRSLLGTTEDAGPTNPVGEI